MIKLIAIGASTGGTDAIIEVVKGLPADCPPVVIVQHMPDMFTSIYAERLSKVCKMRVKEADDGDRLEKGMIVTARADRQLRVISDGDRFYLQVGTGEKVSGHCPSVDVLFQSVAKLGEKDTVGVLLTGMGKDGAQGLLEMKQAGCTTVAQDKESCVVYGMPRAAYELGAVDVQAPPEEIFILLSGLING
ncbi:MAG: chemotaxis protein CheB [Eubacterium sp.]|nr:chemotaxis protein CheB [Eubacterium sp.]